MYNSHLGMPTNNLDLDLIYTVIHKLNYKFVLNILIYRWVVQNAYTLHYHKVKIKKEIF